MGQGVKANLSLVEIPESRKGMPVATERDCWQRVADGSNAAGPHRMELELQSTAALLVVASHHGCLLCQQGCWCVTYQEQKHRKLKIKCNQNCPTTKCLARMKLLNSVIDTSDLLGPQHYFGSSCHDLIMSPSFCG